MPPPFEIYVPPPGRLSDIPGGLDDCLVSMGSPGLLPKGIPKVSACDCVSQPIAQQLAGILTLVFGRAYAFDVLLVGWILCIGWLGGDSRRALSIGIRVCRGSCGRACW